MTRLSFTLSLLSLLNRAGCQSFLSAVSSQSLALLITSWALRAKPHQIPASQDWLIWLLLGGRGAGKTRTGAEWIREQVMEKGMRRIALVAPTYQDAREVMIEGESGLQNIGYPSERPRYSVSRRRLDWPNGAVGYVFSSEDPDGLRGPQFDCAWADEFCAWTHPKDTLSNLRLALRLGEAPQLVMTTTPKPIPALKQLLSSAGLLISRGATSDNQDNLAPNFLAAMEEAYGGTRLGRQELGGEFLEDHPGALWTRQLIEDSIASAPEREFDKIILSIDPPVSTGERADSCGLIVAGRIGKGRSAKAYILHDGTVQGLSPEGWASHAIKLAEGWGVDYMLAEVNQGGDLVSCVLRGVAPHIAIRKVRASRGKNMRAEPVALLYEQGRINHIGRFSALEDELCLMGKKGQQKGSPDRADALVWAVTELLLRDRPTPRVRCL